MTDAKKCDRCGEYYAPSRKSRVIQEYYATGISRTTNGGDVCPICAAKFEKWWRKKRKKCGDATR